MIRIILAIIVIALLASVYFVHRSHNNRNLLPDAGSLTAWDFEQFNKGAGTIALEDGTFRLDVTQVGDVQLCQKHVQLEPGRRYLFLFKARADKPRDLHVEGSTGNWGGRSDPIGLDTHFALSTDWKDLETVFRTNANAAHPLQVPILHVGDRTGTVWLKDIEIDDLD